MRIPPKILNLQNLSYKFSWEILFAAPENKQICKILEVSEIVLKRPSLNKQIESIFCYFKKVSRENFITFNFI